MKSGNASKELYKQLRALPWVRLWGEEVERFERAGARERVDRVAVIRAVGVVFAESGPAAQKEEVSRWLVRLLHDPEEKIRRYAMAALPKIGVGPAEEMELLALLQKTSSGREEKFLGRTLGKIGGAATHETVSAAGSGSPELVQRVKAAIARSESPSAIRLDRLVPEFDDLQMQLRGRRGLEGIVRDEVEAQGRFRVVSVKPGLVVIAARGAFTLGDVFALRCFDTMSFVLGSAKRAGDAEVIEALAAMIASRRTHGLLAALTEGAIRYRLEFIGKGHRRGAVRAVADRAYALRPEILNDAREAPWAIDIYSSSEGDSVELRPRLAPDPRHPYRLGDVPAASHPPLAACLARLAGRGDDERVWDPFCGSGLELIERTLLGGVRQVHGSDHSAAAIEIARRNFRAASLGAVEARFTCCDFREFATMAAVAGGSLTLIISNPPLGRRVPIANLRGLFHDLFAVAARLLQPGGRLVFANPLVVDRPHPALELQSRQVVDLGGFECRLEVYRKRK